ncbi:MAG: hypothetical protein R2713_21080 [Ilumatobacteraceae bacterium]
MSDTTETETPALASDTLREGIVDRLRTTLGDAVVEVHLEPNVDLWVRVRHDAWRGPVSPCATRDSTTSASSRRSIGSEPLRSWRGRPVGAGAEPATRRPSEMRHGVTGGDTRFQVFARVTDVQRHVGITIKADVPDGSSVVDSWVTVYAGASWHGLRPTRCSASVSPGTPTSQHLPAHRFRGAPTAQGLPVARGS